MDTQDPGRRYLPTTRWSLVVGIQAGSEEARREALGHLFERYKKPIYHYFRLRWHMKPEAAQDLTLDFFTMLLESDALRRFQPGRSSFRAYLKGILKHFTQDQIDKLQAEKRGGKVRQLSLSDALGEMVPDSVSVDPEAALDWAWRKTVLDRAMEATEQWFVSQGREAQFRTFKEALMRPQGERPTDAKLAGQLGLTESTVGNHINIVRVKLKEMIRIDLTHTVLDKEQLDEEYRQIIGKI
jgi:RNA polymerase sigma-70 factor (ECF subfamily)